MNISETITLTIDEAAGKPRAALRQVRPADAQEVEGDRPYAQ